MESTDIFLSGSDFGTHSVTVSPVVIMAVLDHHSRRDHGKSRVIGTLLGRPGPSNTVLVTNAYPVPHDESPDNVAVNTDFHRTMLELYSHTSSDTVVGWYASGEDTNQNSLVVHAFYAGECTQNSPVHLLIDADMASYKLEVRGFVSTAYKIDDLELSSDFRPLPVSLQPSTAERVGLDALFETQRMEEQKSGGGASPEKILATELDNVEKALVRLGELLKQVEWRVQELLSRKVEGRTEIGRFLSETLAVVPKVNLVDFEKLLGDNMRDLLMILYLSRLSQAQLTLAEELLSVSLEEVK
mmetsp:Transcript_35168/g.86003  ORF Transcript_35168/g.86003 Transcript_35168/m.86003 type:complete len:300 (-) Transcript_35168:54-953(-)